MAQPLSLPDLQTKIKGTVIGPDHPEYDQARVIFYGGVDKHPAVIVQVANAADVQQVIKLAQETGLELAVRSGGHSVAGHSTTEGGIVLDLRKMKQLEVNAAEKYAWVEPGMTAGEYTQAIDQYDLVTGFGDTGSVGIGGITVAGGIGFLVRKYGLAIDNLRAVEVVTADGQLLTADADTNPDLFWAIRGGGGNFGVVTKFKFALQPMSQAVGGIMVLPATPEVITGFMVEAAKAPEELSTIFNIMSCPPMPFVPAEYHGKVVAMAMMMYAGDAASGEKIYAPFRALATPIADMVKPMRYHEMFHPDDGSYHPTAVATNMFMKQVDIELAKTMLRYLNESDAQMRVVQLRALGGAMARVPADATAFPHRTSPIMANIAAFYTSEADKIKRQAWVDELSTKLYQGDDGAYTGFIGDEGAERVRAAYPDATWNRLVEIKRKYDPTNLFHLNQNITP